MKISVFGGAHLNKKDSAYQEAYRLGKLLAENGHTVLSGGYIGIMEAVSRGAAEAGGHVIGVTCDEIEKWRPMNANAWVKEEWHLPTLRDRLWSLIENCDLAVAMPGGVGTLAEITTLWNHLIINALPAKSVILIGEGWKQLMTTFFDQLGSFIPEHDRTNLLFSPTVDDAVNKINSRERSTTDKAG